MMFGETYWELMTNFPHILFELTYEALTGIVVYPFAKWVWKRALRKHDREVHHQ